MLHYARKCKAVAAEQQELCSMWCTTCLLLQDAVTTTDFLLLLMMSWLLREPMLIVAKAEVRVLIIIFAGCALLHPSRELKAYVLACTAWAGIKIHRLQVCTAFCRCCCKLTYDGNRFCEVIALFLFCILIWGVLVATCIFMAHEMCMGKHLQMLCTSIWGLSMGCWFKSGLDSQHADVCSP